MPQELNLHDFEVSGATQREQRTIDTTTVRLPELSALPSKTTPGKSYDTFVLKERAEHPVFAKHGDGFAPAKDKYDWQTNNCYLLGGNLETDVISRDLENNSPGIAPLQERRRRNEIRNLWEQVVDQLYLGQVNGDPDGFPGFPDLRHPTVINALAGEWNEIDDFVVGDLGTAANTLTNIWLLSIRGGTTGIEDQEGPAWIWGGNKQLTLDEVMRDTAFDANGNPYPIERQFLWGHLGLQHDTEWDIVQIVNVPTQQVEKGGIGSGGAKFHIDNVISRAVDSFPDSIEPTQIWTHHRAHSASRRSRQIINQPGQSGNATNPRNDGQFNTDFSIFDPEGVNLPILKSRRMPTYSGII